MKAKSSAHYQREYRKRMRDAGLVKKEVWVRPENAKLLSEIEKGLRESGVDNLEGGGLMSDKTSSWTTRGLYEALSVSPLFEGGSASIELIDGVDASLHIIMHEYGDLPLFLTVSGDQIVVEAVLWGESDVSDVPAFNDAVLRTHKYFPLSTISLETVTQGEDYYMMFGALSSTSILPNIIFEIEVLASNVLQATEAYSEFISIAALEA